MKNRTRHRLCAVAWAAALLCASVLAAHAEADHAAIARAALTDYIQPGYAQLSLRSGTLAQALGALCAKPSAAALKDAKSAFAGAVQAWGQVELVRFGPIAQEHRYERLFYWPDPKGLGLKQLRAALTKRDASVTDPASLLAKSVALQGLPALEYLLYGDGADALTTVNEDGGFRCRFASSVAANIAAMTGQAAEGWSDAAPFTKDFLAPGPNSPFYRAPKEVTLELLKAFSGGIETVRDQKLAKPLGPKPDEARPLLAAFSLSGLTFANMADNLDGVRELFAKGGLAAIVHAESVGVEDSILFDLNHAIDVLRGIDKLFAEAARDKALRAQLEALRVSLKGAEGTAVDMITRGAGLSFGFNAMDGD
jgi:predicted lipoprotein